MGGGGFADDFDSMFPEFPPDCTSLLATHLTRALFDSMCRLQTSSGVTVQLVGLNITNGLISALHGSEGGGVFVYDGATATFADCQIHSNTADYAYADYGGGVYIDGGAATFTNCEIFENTAAGSVCLCPAPFHAPHESTFPELTPCLCNAMPRQLTRRSQQVRCRPLRPIPWPPWKKN